MLILLPITLKTVSYVEAASVGKTPTEVVLIFPTVKQSHSRLLFKIKSFTLHMKASVTDGEVVLQNSRKTDRRSAVQNSCHGLNLVSKLLF